MIFSIILYLITSKIILNKKFVLHIALAVKIYITKLDSCFKFIILLLQYLSNLNSYNNNLYQEITEILICLFNCEEKWPYFNNNKKTKEKKQSMGANMINNFQSVKTCHWPGFCTVHVYAVVIYCKMCCFLNWGKSVQDCFSAGIRGWRSH